jgi:hypothetical protein
VVSHEVGARFKVHLEKHPGFREGRHFVAYIYAVEDDAVMLYEIGQLYMSIQNVEPGEGGQAKFGQLAATNAMYENVQRNTSEGFGDEIHERICIIAKYRYQTAMIRLFRIIDQTDQTRAETIMQATRGYVSAIRN